MVHCQIKLFCYLCETKSTLNFFRHVYMQSYVVHYSNTIPSSLQNIASISSSVLMLMIVSAAALGPFIKGTVFIPLCILLVISLSVLTKLGTFRLIHYKTASMRIGIDYTDSSGVTVSYDHKETDEKIFEVRTIVLYAQFSWIICTNR